MFAAIAVAVCGPGPEAVTVCVGTRASDDIVAVAIAFALPDPVAVTVAVP